MNNYHMNIQGTATVQETQDAFRAIFPDLQISFFYHAHATNMPSSHSDMVPPETPLSKIRVHTTEGDLEVDPGMEVGAFEQMLMDTYGLNIQVFRRSGDQWIQTTMTDHWTLAKQQSEGHESLKYKH